MKSFEITKGIHWVGAVDWKVRNFHGYLTQLGTSYNAYLILDEKKVLVDAVKAGFEQEFFSRVRSVCDLAEIDLIVCNHVEPDHSGALPALLKECPKARILISPKGEAALKRHYGEDLPLTVVKEGDAISIGQRTLTFQPIPMVHWPDSMVTYIPEERLLFSNDAFGQHIASSERFADELPDGQVILEAAKYYANIVLPYSRQVKGVLATLGGLAVDTIAPSHGAIWRQDLHRILGAYTNWAEGRASRRAVIIYDTMWGSTEKLAREFADALEGKGVPTAQYCMQGNHVSDVITEVMLSSHVLMGCPTLNGTLLPTMAAMLSYMRGLRPQHKVGLAFGSYGWAPSAQKELHQAMVDMGITCPSGPFSVNYVPGKHHLGLIPAAVEEFLELKSNGE
jgi:flavorubredoxin